MREAVVHLPPLRLGTCLAAAILASMSWGCGDPGDDSHSNTNHNDPRCGDGVLDPGEACDDGNVLDGDGCDARCELEGCGDACECAPLADVSELISSGELFIGYSSLGADISIPSCGERETASEIYLSMTSQQAGELVISAAHPTTQVQTVIELRGESCDGTSVGCEAGMAPGSPGPRLTVPVTAGQSYVAMVETANDATGVFALSIHRTGVCEGIGSVQDITAHLLSGRLFTTDTQSSTSSMMGSCSPVADTSPEALLTFVPPHGGMMVATTAHPDTSFDSLLYVRQGNRFGESYCDSPEAEIACATEAPWGGTDPLLRFQVQEGLQYSLFVDGGTDGSMGQATVILGYAAASPASTNLRGCDHAGILDSFAFFVEAGQAVHLLADTADAATAADLRLRVRLPDSTELFEADDDTPCTYPPPAYSCPEYGFTATSGGLYFAEVYVGASESCFDRSQANYVLTVTVEDQPAELIQIQDE